MGTEFHRLALNGLLNDLYQLIIITVSPIPVQSPQQEGKGYSGLFARAATWRRQKRHVIGCHFAAMENNNQPSKPEGTPTNNFGQSSEMKVIPVMEEFAVVSREVVETGKVHIRKKVTEEQALVNLPVVNESYHIERVPVHTVQDTPPPSVRYEGDVMIIPVTKEFTVVQKRYEIVEELRITRNVTETPMLQEISLLKETVEVERIREGGSTKERF